MWQERRVAVLAVCLLALAAGAHGQAAETKVPVKFANTPVREAAKHLAAQLGTTILVDDDVQGDVTVSVDVRRDRAIAVLAAAAHAMPSRAIIFCRDGEAKGEAIADLKGPLKARLDARVGLELPEGTKLSRAAERLAEVGKVIVRTLPSVADRPVAVKLAEHPLSLAIDAVAAKAGCQWVLGWVLRMVDPAEVTRNLEAFAQLPPAEQQRIVDNQVEQALGEFRKLSPEDRRQAIAQAAQAIDSFAERLKGADEGTRKRFREVVAPMIERSMRKFISLDASEQAEIMPLVRALAKLRQ